MKFYEQQCNTNVWVLKLKPPLCALCVRDNALLSSGDVHRFMNSRVPPNKRYQPTEYEHAANCATHAVRALSLSQTTLRNPQDE